MQDFLYVLGKWKTASMVMNMYLASKLRISSASRFEKGNFNKFRVLWRSQNETNYFGLCLPWSGFWVVNHGLELLLQYSLDLGLATTVWASSSVCTSSIKLESPASLSNFKFFDLVDFYIKLSSQSYFRFKTWKTYSESVSR